MLACIKHFWMSTANTWDEQENIFITDILFGKQTHLEMRLKLFQMSQEMMSRNLSCLIDSVYEYFVTLTVSSVWSISTFSVYLCSW